MSDKQINIQMERIQGLRFAQANIAKRFNKAVLSQFDDETIKEVQDFLKMDGWRCLVILGPIGTGKSHLAAAIAREFSKTSCCYYTTIYAMSKKIIEDRNAQHFEKQSMLLIDEITRGYETKAEENRFFDLVNNYYNDEKIMILIGNAQIEDVLKAVGPAIADRMKENLTALVLTGKSKRGMLI